MIEDHGEKYLHIGIRYSFYHPTGLYTIPNVKDPLKWLHNNIAPQDKKWLKA